MNMLRGDGVGSMEALPGSWCVLGVRGFGFGCNWRPGADSYRVPHGFRVGTRRLSEFHACMKYLVRTAGERREVDERVETLPYDSAIQPAFRIFNAHEYNCVRNNFLRAGFDRHGSGDDWCALWTKHLKDEEYMRMSPFQKVGTPRAEATGRDRGDVEPSGV